MKFTLQEKLTLDELIDLYRLAIYKSKYNTHLELLEFLEYNYLTRGICHWYMMKRKTAVEPLNYLIPLDLWNTTFFCPTPEDLLLQNENATKPTRKYYRKGLRYYKFKTVLDTLEFRLKVLEQLKKYGEIYLWKL